MTKLSCDVCGGNLQVASGGIAKCESCGMQHDTARIKEKILEIKGEVTIDHSNRLQNYYKIAVDSYNNSNYREAEAYANKVLEIDSTNSEILFIKGSSAGWQSNLTNIRLEETINFYESSLEYISEKDKTQLKNKILIDFEKLARSFFRLALDRFIRWPDEDIKNEVIETSKLLIYYHKLLFLKTGLEIDFLNNLLGTMIANTTVKAFNQTISPNYHEYGKDRGKYVYERYCKSIVECKELNMHALELSKDDVISRLYLYRDLVGFAEYLLEAHYYSLEYDSFFQMNVNTKKTLPKETQNFWNNFIEEIKQEHFELIQENEEEIIEKFLDNYWKDDVELRSELENKLQEIDEEIIKINTKVEDINKTAVDTNLNEKLNALKNEKSQLGIFSKKRRTINDEIKIIENDIEKQIKKAKEEISKYDSSLRKWINLKDSVKLQLNKPKDIIDGLLKI